MTLLWGNGMAAIFAVVPVPEEQISLEQLDNFRAINEVLCFLFFGMTYT